MLSAATLQPQVFVSLSHLNSLVNSLRGGTCARIQNGGQSQRTLSRACMSETREHTEKNSDAKTKQDKLKQLDFESCMTILLEESNMKKLSAMLGIPEGSHWRTSYVSAPTFFENKNGFSEHMLEVTTLLQRPDVVRLLHRNLIPEMMILQKRWYTTGRSSGLGRASFQDKPSFFKKLTTSKQLLSKQPLEKILKNEKPQVQDKIKLAYAEGVMRSDFSGVKSKGHQFWDTFRNVLSIVVLLVILMVFARSSSIKGNSAVPLFNLREATHEDVFIRFSDVKGCDEAKEELEDIVEYLKDKERFTSMGAKLPKGILLVGTPGVGKTLLAKAVAGEAGVPFYQVSGSEFDEVFVGLGSRRIRSLFAAAKAKAPSVIFIDEIDSVGSKRTSSEMHPHANQTVNQLLSEMDGFSDSAGVIVIGATNKKENLDNALLRPGRFDLEVTVMPPDARGREEIFKLYLDKVRTQPDLDVEKLGRMSTGMTGADINNLVNQAALHAAKLNRHVCMEDIEYARDKILMGPAWKNKRIGQKSLEKTAYHEAGHTLVAYHSEARNTIHKVTILPRGSALGLTAFEPEEDTYGETKAELLTSIDVSMGGRAGEELIYGKENVGTGAYNDFEKATRIATAMVKKMGMSEKVGNRVHQDPKMDGGLSFIQVNSTSPEMQQIIDEEINRILNESYSRALNILKTHERQHKALANALLKYETLSKQEVFDIIQNKTIKRPTYVKPPLEKNNVNNEKSNVDNEPNKVPQ